MQRTRAHVAVIVIILTSALLLPVFGGELKFLDSESAMRKQLLKFIPVGSDIESGKSFLEKNGFSCSWYKQQRFVGFKEKMNYIYCNYQSHDFPVNKRWQIALIPEDNKNIRDISVSFGLVGP